MKASSTRGPSRLIVLASLSVCVSLVTACGSTSGGGGSGSANKEGVARAKAFVADHMDPPAAIGDFKPLASKPPTGKTIAFVGGETTASDAIGAGVKEAAKALGWSVKIYPHTQNPQQASASMKLAVQGKPDAVLSSGYPNATFGAQIKELASSKTPYISNSNTDPIGPLTAAVIESSVDYVARGEWMANYITADSNGDANIALFNLSTYPVLNTTTKAFRDAVASNCGSGCKVAVEDVQASTIGSTLPAQIVSYLRAHPLVNYVVPIYGDMTIGLPEALKSAGLSSKVKLVTQAGAATWTQIEAGQVEVNVPEDDYMCGWAAVDAAVRALTNQPLDQSVYDSLPRNYVTKANLVDPKKPYESVPDFRSQFMKLWKVE